jgi:hypothetical protein
MSLVMEGATNAEDGRQPPRAFESLALLISLFVNVFRILQLRGRNGGIGQELAAGMKKEPDWGRQSG